jgi:hypothetical protein
VLRTFGSGLVRKVAPVFSHSLQSFKKNCHAFRARTHLCFVRLQRARCVHFPKGASTHIRPLQKLRGAVVRPSLLFFVRAFDALARPATPHASAHALARTKVSGRIEKSDSRSHFCWTLSGKKNKCIAAFCSVMHESLTRCPTLSKCIPSQKPA